MFLKGSSLEPLWSRAHYLGQAALPPEARWARWPVCSVCALGEHTHLASEGWGRLWLHAAMIKRSRGEVSCSEKLSRILTCGGRIQTVSTSRALSEGFGVVGWPDKQRGIHSAEWLSLFSSLTATQSCFP